METRLAHAPLEIGNLFVTFLCGFHGTNLGLRMHGRLNPEKERRRGIYLSSEVLCWSRLVRHRLIDDTDLMNMIFIISNEIK